MRAFRMHGYVGGPCTFMNLTYSDVNFREQLQKMAVVIIIVRRSLEERLLSGPMELGV